MKKYYFLLLVVNMLCILASAHAQSPNGTCAVLKDSDADTLKKTEPDPSSEQYHLYWGDVHGHTSYSDGKGTVAEYFQYARDTAKLDFAIVTDHDFGHEAPWRMPQDHWQLTEKEARDHTVDGQFIAIAGYEWTSAPKYWSGFTGGPSENLFAGLPRYYNHKNVYFPTPTDYLFSAKDDMYRNPDMLAAAVSKAGGLIQNNHPSTDHSCRDQFDYDLSWSSVICNTEMIADKMNFQGKTYQIQGETIIRGFLNRGGRTGFVSGSDTHEGKPVARTAVLATALTPEAIFEALRHRRNYAVSQARIELNFQINGHQMGEDAVVEGVPRIVVVVQGTAPLAEVEVIRNGSVLYRVSSEKTMIRFEWSDATFAGNCWYYLRVTQADEDENGNPSRAWSSPIWVKTMAEDLKENQ